MKNKLKIEKQYGLVHKEVLKNKEISANAKGLYVYLAARSGNKYTCNPTVATILKDLGICESTFHTLKKELITKGVIEVVKTGSGITKRNNYNLLHKSKEGYGVVYLDVLTNSNINITSKAIYGLLASYGGSKFVASPLIKWICGFLNICRNTYFKYVTKLKELNIIKTKQVHKNGRYSNCNYYINGEEPSEEHKNKKYIFISEKTTTTKINKEKAATSIEYDKYESIVKDNIEFNSLAKLYGDNAKAKYYLKNIISILTNSIYFETKSKGIVVDGVEVSGERLGLIYNKLGFNHIKKVVENLLANVNKIKNIRKYVKVALYNTYFQLEQKHYNLTK